MFFNILAIYYYNVIYYWVLSILIVIDLENIVCKWLSWSSVNLGYSYC